MRILLVYYHPICLDIAAHLNWIGYDVTLSVNPNIKDNYGTGHDLLAKYSKFDWIKTEPLSLSLLKIKAKNNFDVVGCDGVFDGDDLIMAACKEADLPFFNIQGYPMVFDEPSNNILSLGWFLPHVQYLQKYSYEGLVKEIDWASILTKGRSEQKNIFVYYPFPNREEFLNYNPNDKDWEIAQMNRKFVSLIQGYKKWNPVSYEIFKKISSNLSFSGYKISNLEGQSKEAVYKELKNSRGLLHLKWADQPGIAIFEAMLLGRPVFTMKSFVNASFNQEVLIDGYNAVIADSVDELKRRMTTEYVTQLGPNALQHAKMLCSWERQSNKFKLFLENCK